MYLGDELILREATILENFEDLTIADRMYQFEVFGILVLYGRSEVVRDLQGRVFTELSARYTRYSLFDPLTHVDIKKTSFFTLS